MDQSKQQGQEKEMVGIPEPTMLSGQGEDCKRTEVPPQSPLAPILSHRKAFESSFHSLLPELQEESKIQKARGLLGDIAKDMTDEELSVYLTQFEYLLETWLDSYEKQLFNGLTLHQMLRER